MGTREVPVEIVGLGEVVGIGTALVLLTDGAVAVTVPAEGVIDLVVTAVDADPPTEALPQPARTSPTTVTIESNTVRVVRRLLDFRFPTSIQ